MPNSSVPRPGATVLHAQLRGKLPTETWSSSEDMLTNAVFGALRYAGAGHLAAVLRSRRDVSGVFPELGAESRIDFWPRWRNCEPDVVLEDTHTVVAVEAKLWSGFADDVGLGAQLEREARDAIAVAAATGRSAALLVVTNDGAAPRQALEQQILSKGASLPVAWIGWGDILLYMARHARDVLPFADVLDVAQVVGILPFAGFGKAAVPSVDDLQEQLTIRARQFWQELTFSGFGAAAVNAAAATEAHLHRFRNELGRDARTP